MSGMQFWGIDVKAKEPCKVDVEDGWVLHLSQATLSEVKKDSEPVTVHVKVGGKKLVLGMLNQTTPQLSFDLVFDTEFEISHNWKNGSVHLLGYQTELREDGGMSSDGMMFSDESEEEEEDVPVLQKENGKAPAAAVATAVAAAAKPKVPAKPAKDNKPKPDLKDESDDDSDVDSSDDESDEDMISNESDEDDDEDDEDDEEESEEEKPAKAESGKKRPNADAKTPESKKAKLVTPQKTDGKKGAHTATPHPSKKASKSPAGDKSTPKSGGNVSCNSCKKTFNSDTALQSHNKAKHSAK